MTSTAVRQRPRAGAPTSGGLAARRAVVRWAWRLFRREWRQQIMVVALLVVAVAATVFGVATAYNGPSSGRAVTFGTADRVLTLNGDDPNLAADLAAVKSRYGAADVIANRTIAIPGTATTIDLRAQDPHGRFGRPMLSLRSGRYPSGAGEVAVTSTVADLLGLHLGDVWTVGGQSRRVVGTVENPANLLDQFALVAPGQLAAASNVTILFDAPPAPHPCASAACAGPPRFAGGAAARVWASTDVGASPTTVVVVVAAFGLIFIGLVAAAGFAVMAQRRMRGLGLLAGLGATDRNVGLVMMASGAVTGLVGSLIGTAIGLGAWIAYAPHLQREVERRVEWSHLPWLLIVAALVLTVLTTVAAAWRPARSAARMPVVAALSGQPEPETASYWSAGAGLVLLVVGLGCLASSGGWDAEGTRHSVTAPSPLQPGGGLAAGLTGWTTGQNTAVLLAGILGTVIGVLLLAPLAVALPALLTRRAPIAVRLALRDLGRYRARSGAVLAATTFAVMLAAMIAILTTGNATDPFTPNGPNLAANQIVVYAPHGPAGSGPVGSGPPATAAQLSALDAGVTALADSIHAQFAVPLESAGRLDAGANTAEAGTNQRAELWRVTGPVEQFPHPLYVATPTLLHDLGIDPRQVDANADIVTSEPGLASASHLALTGQGDVFDRHVASGQEVPGSFHLQCPAASCIADPRIQTLSHLPTGTSAPGTLITERAVQALGQQLIPDGWLVQTKGPLTAAQQDAARRTAITASTRIEVGSGAPDLSTAGRWATIAGVLLAIAVLAMTVGLIRSETASDLRILTAAGAGSSTRRILAAATAGALGVLGAVLGTAAAYLGIIVWAHAAIATTLVPVPVLALVALLLVMPVAASVVAWLLAGKEPAVIGRQPQE